MFFEETTNEIYYVEYDELNVTVEAYKKCLYNYKFQKKVREIE